MSTHRGTSPSRRSVATRAKGAAGLEWISRSVEHTLEFGERLGGRLEAGAVVALIGDLGTGKTTLVHGMAKGLGIDPSRVKSPTFVLFREYAGRVPLIHLDGYRLEHHAELVWMDLEWVFSAHKIIVIEWADRFHECLPEDYVEIRLRHKTTNQRAISLTGHGPRSGPWVEAMRTQLPSESPSPAPARPNRDSTESTGESSRADEGAQGTGADSAPAGGTAPQAT